MILNKPNFWDYKNNSIWSILLLPFTLILLCYNFFKFKKKRKKFNIPIVCVGNIYLGGTGKTPLCIEIHRILKSLKFRPAFIKKYYKESIDEMYLLEKTGSVFIEKTRINSINLLINNNYDAAILDDGFQDHEIKIDISIVCFNQRQWIGNGHLIPAGPLREKLSSLNRSNFVFINGKKDLNNEKIIKKNNPNIKIYYTSYQPYNLENFKNKKLIAFAGIGNPKNFFDVLINNNLEILKSKSFPDHYNFSKKDITNLKETAEKSNAILLTTEKDYLRIKEKDRENIKYLKIKLKINKEEEFINNLKGYL